MDISFTSLSLYSSPSGHGNVTSQKSPTKVECISGVKEVSCGVAHTLALSSDGLTVWSFGSGDSGKLGHGDTIKHTTPTVRA